MYDRWSLEIFYKDANDPKIESDMAELEALYQKYTEAVSAATYDGVGKQLREIMELKEKISDLSNCLFVFFKLRRSGMGADPEGEPYRTRVQKLISSGAKTDALFKKYVGGIEDISAAVKGDGLLSEYEFYLNGLKDELKYCLHENSEDVFNRLSLSGGVAWTEQYSYLMSHTEADFMGGKKTLNALQTLVKSADGEVRKAAYEALLSTYPQIRDPLAFSINNIKAQVLTEAELRGFDSPLDMSLFRYRMKKETLDAMWDAVRGAFPKLREYLKCKAKLLGYEKGLPWYDIYAPIGKTVKEYTVEDTHKYLVEHFKAFSGEMSEMMDRAFKEEWIDFHSRPGKSGGAFCYSLPWFGESRILTNFNGNFGAVNTIAHELGHAFHGQQLVNNRPLNRVNPLPILETASTFNELFLMNNAIACAEGDERITLIDKQITDSLMILPDMYTRYKLEDELFKRRKNGFVYGDEIEKLMTDLQKEVYGDALDEDYLYPYVWCDKSHYYSSSRSYYNFPYSMCCLFARGLYVKYLEEGEAFVPKYKEMLKATPVNTVEGAALIAGIDITDREFWNRSMQTICDSIDMFIEEADK